VVLLLHPLDSCSCFRLKKNGDHGEEKDETIDSFTVGVVMNGCILLPLFSLETNGIIVSLFHIISNNKDKEHEEKDH
jgi:hypothetical protein